MCICAWKEGVKGLDPLSSAQGKDRKQWHRLKYKKFFLNLWEKIILNYKGGQTGVQISQGSVDPLSFDVPKSNQVWPQHDP